MSLTTIDAKTYYQFLSDAITRYMGYGFTRAEARQAAQTLMNNCFLCDTVVAVKEHQKDHLDEINNDWTR